MSTQARYPVATDHMWTPRRKDNLDLAALLAKIGPSMFMIILVVLVVLTCASQLHAVRSFFHFPH